MLIGFYVTVPSASALNAIFNSSADVPVTAAGYDASGQTITITLNFTPAPGTNLMVVKNTSTAPIAGPFSNLAPGTLVPVTHSGTTYQFIASYTGGTGNDLVLLWPGTAAYAWGYNFSGQLGDGTTDDSPIAMPVLRSGAFAETTLTSITGASFHTLTATSDGRIYGWGYNGDGELGDGSVNDRPTPGEAFMDGALNGKTVIALSHGSLHSLALTADGLVYAWGYNGSGQLGDGTDFDHSIPMPVDASGALAGKFVIAIAGGDDHSLALTSEGKVYAWGRNDFGQLGDGTTTRSDSPVPVSTLGALAGKTVVAIGGGHSHSLALTSEGLIYAWGFNQNGQLGDGTTANSSEPVAVTMSGVLNGKTVTAIAAGGDHNIVLVSDGHVYGWGRDDYGQLGDDSTLQSNTPVAVDTTGTFGAKTIVAISAGHTHSLALSSDGKLFAWGNNSSGQLGDGTTINRVIPVQTDLTGVLSGKTITSIACGGNHTLVLAAAPQAPDIAIDQPLGTVLVAGASSVDFGSAPAASSVTRTFTVRNTGTANLDSIAVTKSGPQAAEYIISGPAVTSLAAGGSTTFTVTFTAGGSGARNATLHVLSNDPDESPFDIQLTGTGFTEMDAWRNTWFGSPFNSGDGADGADPDHDGIVNLVEFATHSTPTAASGPVGSLVRNGASLEFTYTCDKSAVSAGLVFKAEWTDNLVAGPWSSAGVTSTSVDHVNTVDVTATIPTGGNDHRFVRLSVTKL